MSDDVDAQLLLRQVRSRLLARQGQYDDAERLARDALSLLEATDDLEARARTLITLAEVLRSSGRRTEAVSAAEEAVRVCEEKGNLVLGRQAQQLLDALATPPRLRTPVLSRTPHFDELPVAAVRRVHDARSRFEPAQFRTLGRHLQPARDRRV
ncbi:MAG: tetratricopeptide repeat protein [Gaiellaceae bacterium]